MQEKQVLIEEPLSNKTRLSFSGIAASQWCMSNIAFSPITFYYNIKLGLDAWLIGLAWLIFAFYNAINDPVFGIIEDRTRTKMGRRIPYIRYGAPFLGLFFVLLWIPLVDITNDIALFIYFLFMLIAFDTVFTFMGLANGSLFPEIAFSSKERAKLSIYANLLTAIGTGISFVVPLVLLTGESSTTINPLLYPAMILLAVIASSIIFYCTYNLKEKSYLQNEECLGLIDSIKETFKNKPWLLFTAAGFSYTIANTIFLTGIYYYIDYIIRLSGIAVILPLLIIFGMVIVLTILLPPLMKRYTAKKLYLFGFLITDIGMVLLFIFGWSTSTALIAMVPLGIGFGAISILMGVIGADTMDYDELRTGKRRECTYGGIGALVGKPAISIANWLFLLTISSYGFQDGIAAEGQPNSAFLGIMIGFTVIPAIFTLITLLIMIKFPLDGPEWEEQKLKIKKVHEEKEREFQQKYGREF